MALFAGSALLLGLKQSARRGAAGRGLLILSVVYAALLAMIFVVYCYGVDRPLEIVLGFPTSTAVLLFVLWPFPLLIVLLYAVRYPRWIISTEDQQEFRALVEKRRQREAR